MGNGETSKRDAELKPGDHVAWNTSQGGTTGAIKKRRTEIHDHDIAASTDNPE